MADDLTLNVGGRDLSGWTDIRVSLGIERCPNDFEVEMTELFPGQADKLVIQPGDTATVKLGSDLVVTGFVDRFAPRIEAEQHLIRVTGRGKCQDLVDCSAEWPGGQISGASVLSIAQKLAKPYGISVAADVDVGGVIPQFNLLLGETAYTIIERVCRYRALLAYEKPDGSLFLSRAGSKKSGSGIAQGKNVQDAEIVYAFDQRYSQYDVYLQSVDTMQDAGQGGNLPSSVYDKGVKRNRKLDIVAEAGGGGLNVAQQRALWEAARRTGRAYAIKATVDSWRDGAGALWAPNTIVPVDLPFLKLPKLDWVLGDVTFQLNERGTTAKLVIMPKDAFNPEPILLQPFAPDVAQAFPVQR